MNKALLVDLDGTLSNTACVWRQIEANYQKLGPSQSFTKLLELYKHVTESGSGQVVADVINKGQQQIDKNIWKIFYDIDFKSCFDWPGWHLLRQATNQHQVVLHLFTQGDTALADNPLMPKPYQVHKVEQLKLDLPPEKIHIYEDKIAALPMLLQALRQTGIHKIGLIDDNIETLARAQKIDGSLGLYQKCSSPSLVDPRFIPIYDFQEVPALLASW